MLYAGITQTIKDFFSSRTLFYVHCTISSFSENKEAKKIQHILPWSIGKLRVPCGFLCMTWIYVVECMTIVKSCNTRQKWPIQYRNDWNKVTKRHHILHDKNAQNNTKIPETKSQKHKTGHSNVQFSDIYKSLHSKWPRNHTKKRTIPLIKK